MIQLANDPNASRPSFRPQDERNGKPSALDAKGKSGHSWPFLSRYATRPARQESKKPGGSDTSGS
jgi:hypothetical protein